jgi:hypothetical protein
VRFGFGAAMGDGASRNFETAFAFDFTAGLFLHKDRTTFMFMPEIGVSYQGGPSPGGTYFTAGSSVFYGNMLFGGGLLARGLIGGSSSGFAGGFRTGLVLQGLLASITVDLSYQFLPTATDNRHGFVGTVSINPLPLVGLALMVGAFRLGRGG